VASGEKKWVAGEMGGRKGWYCPNFPRYRPNFLAHPPSFLERMGPTLAERPATHAIIAMTIKVNLELNKMKEVPANLDWITARRQCSIGQVFELLKTQVEKDVDIQNVGSPHKFSVHRSRESFTVICGDGGGIRSVIFAVCGNTIQIKDGDRKLLFTAGLTLNDAGECKLKLIDGPDRDRELEFWQFRRRPLEGLFFSAD
jgi:hypothetical protein